MLYIPTHNLDRCFIKFDDNLLREQRSECFKIMASINQENKEQLHPCVQMWVDYKQFLMLFTNKCMDECDKRGFTNHTYFHYLQSDIGDNPTKPWWWGWDRLHLSHRAGLIHKDPDTYEPRYLNVPAFYLVRGYIWPSKWTPEAINDGNNYHKYFSRIGRPAIDKPKVTTVDELKILCRDKGIRGYSKMNRGQIVKALKNINISV